MNKQDLDAVVEGGESDRVEFTECPAGKLKADKVGKTICAFANGSGGRLFLGISDKGTDKIKGFATTNEQMGDIHAYADRFHPSIPLSLQKIPLDSSDNNTLHVVMISVEEGDSKPYSYKSRFFKRFGASTREMPPDEIRIHMEKTGKIKFDRAECTKFNYPEHFDRKKLIAFLDKAKREYEDDDVVSLEKLGVVYSSSGSKVTLNNAGALLFAKNLQEIYPHTEVACVIFNGGEDTAILDHKVFNSDIISNIEEVLLYLKKNLRTVYRFVPGQARREEALEIPEEALREAVVNAVVHRDYFDKSNGVTIEIYQDRVRIANLGGLPEGMKMEYLGVDSKPRNHLLTSLLKDAGYVEKWGTGIRKIRNSLQEAGISPAKYEADTFFSVTFQRQAPEDLAKPKPKMIMSPEKFTGTLVVGQHNIDVSLVASADCNGQLTFDVEPLTPSPDAWLALLRQRGKVGETVKKFKLDCRSESGKHLSSENIALTIYKEVFKGEGQGIHIGIRANKARLHFRTPDQPKVERQRLMFHLPVAEHFPRTSHVTELGTVSLEGASSKDKEYEAMCLLSIEANDDADMDWQQRAEKLLHRMRVMIGFFQGAYLFVPITTYYYEDNVVVTLYKSNNLRIPSLMPAMPMFKKPESSLAGWLAGLNAITEDDWLAVGTAMNWSTTIDRYNFRFLAGMIAIGALVTRFLGKTNKKKNFRDKIILLLEKWNINRTLLSDKEIDRIVRLRDAIIDEGQTLEEDGQDDELWSACLTAREIILRVVFAMLKFEGKYQCYIGGAHTRLFPSCKHLT